jgi:hypothetical protein
VPTSAAAPWARAARTSFTRRKPSNRSRLAESTEVLWNLPLTISPVVGLTRVVTLFCRASPVLTCTVGRNDAYAARSAAPLARTWPRAWMAPGAFCRAARTASASVTARPAVLSEARVPGAAATGAPAAAAGVTAGTPAGRCARAGTAPSARTPSAAVAAGGPKERKTNMRRVRVTRPRAGMPRSPE